MSELSSCQGLWVMVLIVAPAVGAILAIPVAIILSRTGWFDRFLDWTLGEK